MKSTDLERGRAEKLETLIGSAAYIYFQKLD
jgi:hypothetical protein